MTLHDSMLPLLLVSSAFRCQDAFSFRRELRLLEIVRPAQAAEHRFGGQAQCPGKVNVCYCVPVFESFIRDPQLLQDSRRQQAVRVGNFYAEDQQEVIRYIAEAAPARSVNSLEFSEEALGKPGSC